MLDFVLGLFLAALLVRGWMRGFVREILDLVGLVVGLWIAFKLSQPFGDFLANTFGVTSEIARVGAGISLFVLFGISMSVAAHYLSKVMRLPGLNMINRAGGAAVAVAWGIAIVVVIVNVVRIFPIPDSWVSQIDQSSVAQTIAGPESLAQQTFEVLAGDSALGVISTLRGLFGTSRVVLEGTEPVDIPPAESDEIRQVRGEAEDVLTELNEYRTGLGLGALHAATVLTQTAEARSEAMYVSGLLSRECVSTSSGALPCVDFVALAGTALGGLDGILESDTGKTEMVKSVYDRAGVSVVDGPTGRLLVIILGG